jgi:hypothetical protein
MNKIGKLILVGVLSTISLPALAHGRGQDKHRGRRDHHERRDHDGRRDHDRDRDRRGPRWQAAPVHRHVWLPGHWSRHRDRRVWIEAHWALPPQPAWTWVAPRWAWNGSAWYWQEGQWVAPVR